MNTFFIHTRAYLVAGRWNELSLKQIQSAIHIMRSGADIGTQMVRLLFVLAKPVMDLKTIFRLRFRVSSEGIYDMLRLCSFFYEDLDLTLCKLPMVRSRTGLLTYRKLYAPKHNILPSLTFIEFIQCEVAFHDYLYGEDAEAKDRALDLLTGILYRVDRDHFDSDDLEYYSMMGSGVNVINKLTISVWYEGCRNDWTKKFPEVFPGQKKSGQKLSKDEAAKPVQSPGSVWMNALRTLSGGAIHIDEMARTKAQTALYELNLKIIEDREREEELQRLKKS